MSRRNPVLTEIAKIDDFTLFHTSGSTPEWAALKLVRLDGPKKAWWLGWNGERLARNSDTELLEQYHPDVAEKVRVAAQASILTRRPK